MKLKNAAPFVVCCAVVVFCGAPLHAGTKHRSPTPETPPAVQRPAYVFENCDLPTVLKVLAYEAHMALELDPSIRGTVNMRMEDVDAKQAIDVLVQSENLKLEAANGVYRIRATDKTDDAHKVAAKPAEGFEAFGQALAKTLVDVADATTKPEVAAKFAKYKRNYYLALMNEGFSAEEALRIVVAAGDPFLSNGQKGK